MCLSLTSTLTHAHSQRGNSVSIPSVITCRRVTAALCLLKAATQADSYCVAAGVNVGQSQSSH